MHEIPRISFQRINGRKQPHPIAANLLLTAAMIFVIYRRFLEAADVWTAALIGLGITFVFAFAEFTPYGNYNYIAPYSHETFHGLVLSVFTIALLCDWVDKGRIWSAMAAGFCTGLVFVTKPDIFMALALAAAVAIALFWRNHGRHKLAKPLATSVLTGILPSLFFFFYFLRSENARDSLRSVLFGWLPLLQGNITKNPFYLWCMGMDKPRDHLKEIGLYFLAVVFVVAIYAFILRWMKNLKSVKLQYALLVVLISPLLIWAAKFVWFQCGWPLPLLCLSAFILILWNYKRLEQPSIFPLLWSVFALALLAKLGLFPRIWHYGFALAMPAFASSIYLLFWLVPSLLERRLGVPSVQFRIMVGLVLLLGYRNLFDFSQAIYDQKSLALGNGGDRILTYNLSAEESHDVCGALLWAEKYLPPGATLAVLPEGVTLNYLTRHVNPTPCLFWDPNCLAMFGQSNMVAAFEANPPDYIFIADRDYSEFKAGNFGESPDFCQSLMEWIGKNYQPQFLIGNEPLKGSGFGIKILKRVPAAQAQSGGFNDSKSLSSPGDK